MTLASFEPIIVALCVLSAVGAVALILLQQGKGAEAGASFGSGSSSTIFGPQGTGTVFSHATAILITVFFICCFLLAIIAKHKVNGNVEAGIPSQQVIDAAQQKEAAPQQPATDIPAPTSSSNNNGGDIPKK